MKVPVQLVDFRQHKLNNKIYPKQFIRKNILVIEKKNRSIFFQQNDKNSELSTKSLCKALNCIQAFCFKTTSSRFPISGRNILVPGETFKIPR